MTAALLLATAGAGQTAADPVAEAIRRQLESAGQPAAIRIGTEVVHASEALPGFYERRGFAPAWFGEGRLALRAKRLLETISRVDADGLRPTDYHLEALRPRIDQPAKEAVLEPIAGGEEVGPILAGLRPRHEGYDRLVRALSRYREIEAAGGWPKLPEGPSIKPGAADPAVTTLRRRLEITGDFAGGETEQPQFFDDALVEALSRFQRRHGLDDDGVVGPKTREALNVSVQRRVRSLELNLERWRWLPQDLGQRHLLVNVPAYELRVSENGRDVLTMRVIVGRAMRRTPVFSDLMRYLVFSPSWEVPPTILRQDKLPEIRKNPKYPAEQNMRVFQLGGGNWNEVDPSAVDWSRASGATIRLRQRPGPTNALGLVKFMFPNPFNVYLHDTPSRELFARSQRDFSSGCVRIEKPAELALYLLADDPAWGREAVIAAMESGQERSVTLSRPIPVHIQYWTAWAASDGTVEFRKDIYGRDTRLDAALRLPPPDETGE